MNDFNQEILLNIRAEGRGQIDSIKEAMAALEGKIQGAYRALGEGGPAASQADRDLKRLTASYESLSRRLAEVDPAHQKLVQSMRDVTRAYTESEEAAQGMAALQKRLGEMEATDHAAEQERLRERATRRAEELQEEERLARKKQANIDAYVDGYKKEAQVTTLQAHAVRELAAEEASLNQVINVGAPYIKGRNLDADRTNKYLEEQARLLRRGMSAEDEAAEANKRFGYSILHVSHAIQDMQYGFGALLNNIPLVVQAFGGSAGLAGGVMIAGVAIDTLIRHFDKVKGAIVDTSDVHKGRLDRMAEDVERLNGAWFRNRGQIKEAEQATRDLVDATEAAKIKAMPTEDESGHKRAFEETVKKLPGGAKGVESVLQDLYVNQFQDNPVRAIQRGLEDGRIPDPQNLMASPERFAQAMDDPRMFRMLKEQWFEKVLPAMIDQTTVGLAKGDVPTFRGFMGQAAAHPRLGAKDGDQFANPFLRGLQENDPRAIKAQKEVERNLEAEQRRNVAAFDAVGDAKNKEVSTLVSKKAKPLEGELTDDILERIKAGDTREDIAVEMNDEVLRRMGDVPHAKEAAAKIARQLMETVFADVMAAKGPGIDDKQAARNLLRENAAAAATKGAKVLKDPVTGNPLSEAQKEELEQIDRGLKARRKEREQAGTPQGIQREFRENQLANTQGLADEIGFARPDLTGPQVLNAAQTANNLMGQGWNKVAALNEAVLRLNMEMMQNMQLLQARQQGFTGTVGQLRQQNRRMMQPGTSLMPNPWPQFGNGR